MSDETPTDDELRAAGVSEDFIRDTRTPLDPLRIRLSRARKAVGRILKGGYNKHHKYKFLSEEQIKLHVQPALDEEFLFPDIDFEIVDVQEFGKLRMFTVKCIVTFREGDDVVVLKCNGCGMNAAAADKSLTHAQTVAFRELWRNAFAIPSGEDAELYPDAQIPDDKPANGTKKADKPSQGHPANKPTEEQLAGLKTLREGLKLGSRDISAIINHAFGKRFGDMNAIEAERLAELLTSLPAEVAAAVRDDGDLTDVPIMKGGA